MKSLPVFKSCSTFYIVNKHFYVEPQVKLDDEAPDFLTCAPVPYIQVPLLYVRFYTICMILRALHTVNKNLPTN